jgi:AraC-like DNA-binding protein
MKKIENEQHVAQIRELAKLIEKNSDEDGIHSTAIPSLHFIRSSQPSKPIHSVHEPALCIVAQGTKVVALAQESFQYGRCDYLVVSVDLPITGQVVQATEDSPYLCLRLDFDPGHVFDMISETDKILNKKSNSHRGLYVSKTNSSLLDAVVRLVRLLETPQDIPVLAPLMIREILYRILQGEQGDAVKQIALIGSHAQRIAKVIHVIKSDFAKPLRIEDLAKIANMSSSTFHHHFKEVTGLSPLQYQKQLRLQEARRLLLSGSSEAAEVGFLVGYESPSQFSREYSRMFGLPPISDVKALQRISS